MEQRRCMGCMELYNPGYGVCPYCGYVEGTSADETVHMAPGTVLEGRYIIGKVLGYGGFGATYIAWDPVLEQKVAIKEYLPSEFSTRMPGIATVTVFGGDRSEQFREGMEKFVEEAKRLSKFQNEPGIVKIFDSFQANGTAYIIMEYLDGETLTSYLDREGTVSEEKVMEMLLPVMQSLQVVHNEGLLHRDIAPDNIFITKEGNVKLIDFGASRYATTSHSRSLTVIIKPGYSPEEQYRSHGDQGPHTDVYALAAVMYKMLTGMTPPDALERRAMIETKKKELLPDVHKKAKYVSPIMENAVLNAMNIQIEDRTADIPSFLAELQADKPVKRRYGKIKKIDVYAWPLWLKIVIPAVLAASVVTGILLATGVIDFPSLFSGKVVIPEGMVEVPNVEQINSDEAMQILQDAGLTPVPKGNVESSYVEAGLILLQNPSGGTFARLGAQIYLTVSSGGEVVGPVNGIATVPYVVWNTQADAEAKLQKAGLKARITTAYDDNVNAGMVISQSVEQSQQVTEGTEITLVVSLGQKNSSIPSQQPSAQQPPVQQPNNNSHATGCPFTNRAAANENGIFSFCSTSNNDGVEYVHVREDGNRKYQYNYYPSGELAWKCERLYDASGREIQCVSYYASGVVDERQEYTYYPSGTEKQMTRYYHDTTGNMTSWDVHNYSPAGNVTDYSEYYPSGNVKSERKHKWDSVGTCTSSSWYEYDTAGKWTYFEEKEYSKITKQGVRVFSDGKQIGTEIQEYDSAGDCVKRTGYDLNENLTLIEENEYYANHNRKKTTNYSYSAGKLDQRNEITYSSANIITGWISLSYDSAGNVTTKSVNEYDTAGNVIASTSYDAAGKITYQYEHEYDSVGNKTKSTVYEYDSSGSLVRKTVYDGNGNVIG